jgi:MFS family permease
VLLAVGAGVVAAMQVGKVPPALPAIRAELAIGMVEGGWVASLFAVTSATIGIAAGLLGDRFGPRSAAAGALACIALGSLAGGFADGLAWLLAARFLESIGFVGLVVSVPALIVTLTAPGDRGKAIGLWSTYLPTGFALMLLAAPPLLSAQGWRGLWFGNAGLVAAFLLLFWLAFRRMETPAPGQRARRSWREVGQSLARPGAWLLAFCFLLYALQWFAVMTWLPTYLIESQGRPAAGAATITALVVLINIGGNLSGTWLSERRVPRWLLITVSALATGCLGGGIFTGLVPEDAKLVLAFAYSLIAGITPAAALIGAVHHAPSPAHVASTNGIVIQGAQCGSLLGPPVLAWVVGGAAGWSQAPWLFLGLSTCSVVLALVLRRVERR